MSPRREYAFGNQEACSEILMEHLRGAKSLVSHIFLANTTGYRRKDALPSAAKVTREIGDEAEPPRAEPVYVGQISADALGNSAEFSGSGRRIYWLLQSASGFKTKGGSPA